MEHKKYNSNKKNLYGVRKISDRICQEHDLSVIEPSKNKGKSYKEYTAEKTGTSDKAKLKLTIDTLIADSIDFDDFLKRMEVTEYEIKQGKSINLLIDIQNNIKAQESKGFEDWAKINNLKQAAKTLNFLTENNLTTY